MRDATYGDDDGTQRKCSFLGERKVKGVDTDYIRSALYFSDDCIISNCLVPHVVLGIKKVQQKRHNGRANS